MPKGYVPRPRLLDLVAKGVEGPVTLVSAHAGTGKSVLIASWARDREDVAWLTLDRDDNWSPQLWLGMELALERGGALTADSAADDPVVRLAERLGERKTPVVLVLDDVQELESPIVLRELENLLSHAPCSIRFIIATRADPLLGLHRLRLNGGLTEIRAADLAFTREECTELLERADLGADQIDVLHARTEGWAAGLRLAALSLEREPEPGPFIDRFAGDERAVADYLLREILERQTDRRREFLLRTCIADSLTDDLAQLLSGHPGAGRILAELESENFLVSGHDERGGVYRYHALLRDFLRAEVGRVRQNELSTLHKRCARWHWAHGDPLTAFRHALSGEDWDLADELTADAWHIVVFAATPRIRDALLEVPESAMEAHPGLAMRVGSVFILHGDRHEAERLFALGEQMLDELPEERRRPLEALALTFAMTRARLDGDFERAAALALEVISAPAGGRFAVAERARAQRAIGLANLGTAAVALGDFADAELYLQEALGIATDVALDQIALNCLSQLALLECSRGRLRRAAEVAGEAIEFAERRGWLDLMQGLGAHLALGWAYYQWDDLATASRYLARAESVARAWGDRTGKVGAAVLQALVLSAEGTAGAAKGLRLLRAVRSDLRGWTPPIYLTALLATAESRVLAARGDFDDALGSLDGSSEDALVRARLLLARGAPAEALAELEAGADRLGGDGLPARVEAGVLEAVARHELNDSAGADVAFRNALTLAAPNSYRRAFVDGGPTVRTLLVDQIRHGTDQRALVAELIAALERRAGSVDLTQPQLLEPLSERERAVLRYLPTMMSNAEIASELFLSVNTVKTHLKSIYRKLGTTRRRDAVERARRLELL
ncbi:MAG TPA: LuxR C-terminal-related transcriptional regulator [Gaiellaceae bacterium]|nr:LuxR C-terminal-related transcriptional regulator [Gaiellaceae bacterium]